MDVAQLTRRAGCAALGLLSVVSVLKAQDPLLSPRSHMCAPACPPGSPRVIVHLSKPEIYYDDCEEPKSCLKKCLPKRRTAGTAAVQQHVVASVVTPMNLVSANTALVQQGVGLNSLQSAGPDLSRLQTLYQIQALAAQQQAYDSARQAQLKIENDVQSAVAQHLTQTVQSLSASSYSKQNGTTQALTDPTATATKLAEIENKLAKIASDCQDMKKDLEAIRNQLAKPK